MSFGGGGTASTSLLCESRQGLLPADCVGTLWVQGAEPETSTESLFFPFLGVFRGGVLWFLVVEEGLKNV